MINISYLLTGRGIKYLFPIQYSTFDYVYDGFDVIGQASKCSNPIMPIVYICMWCVCVRLRLCMCVKLVSVAVHEYIYICYKHGYNIVLLGTGTGKTVSLFTLDYTALSETHYTVAFFCSATG